MKHFYIEQKLDGDRMLAHVSPDSVRLFSRKSNEFPDYANILAPYLRRALGGPDGAREAILDGELMTWDPEFKRCVRLCVDVWVVSIPRIGSVRALSYVDGL